MDRASLLQYLAEAGRHLEEDERHFASQEQVVAELRRHGHDAKETKEVLTCGTRTLFMLITEPIHCVN
ncbi:hypothetical protein Q3C01_13490 [Bradyrhizobium sp. UFLA05-109]